jgi:glucose/arabinose dehydrogenase
VPKKQAETKPPPILKIQTSGEMKDIERIRSLLDQARRVAGTGSEGAVARKRQFLNSLINPHATAFLYEDHNASRKSAPTFSSQMAADRANSIRDLRAQGKTRHEVGDLLGITPTGVQAVEERAAGKRAKQKRITLSDAERLEQAKSADAAVSPPNDTLVA